MKTGPDGRPVVALYCGREVSSWSPEWRAECLERHQECLRLESMVDKLSRLARLDAYQAEVTARAAEASHADPDSVGAEAAHRVRELVLSRWRERMAARERAAQTQEA